MFTILKYFPNMKVSVRRYVLCGGGRRVWADRGTGRALRGSSGLPAVTGGWGTGWCWPVRRRSPRVRLEKPPRVPDARWGRRPSGGGEGSKLRQWAAGRGAAGLVTPRWGLRGAAELTDGQGHPGARATRRYGCPASWRGAWAGSPPPARESSEMFCYLASGARNLAFNDRGARAVNQATVRPAVRSSCFSDRWFWFNYSPPRRG